MTLVELYTHTQAEWLDSYNADPRAEDFVAPWIAGPSSTKWFVPI